MKILSVRIMMLVLFFMALAISLTQFFPSEHAIIVAQAVQASGIQDDAVVMFDVETGVRVNIALPGQTSYEEASNDPGYASCHFTYLLNDDDPGRLTLVHQSLDEPDWELTAVAAPTDQRWYVDASTISPSPDGNRVFLPSEDAGVIVDTRTASQTNIVLEQANRARGGVGHWSQDSRFLMWRVGNEDTISWYRFDAETQQVKSLTLPGYTQTFADQIPALWSPDSSTFATLNTQIGSATIQVVLIDGETLATRIHEFSAIGQMAWLPDSQSMIVIARLEGASSGFSPFTGIKLDTITGDWTAVDVGDYFFALSGETLLSPDGKWLSSFLIEQESDIAQGRITIAVMNLEGDIRFSRQVNHGIQPFSASGQRWSADSRYYAALVTVAESAVTHTRVRHQLFVGDMRTGETQIIETQPMEALLTWLPNQPEIVFVTRGVQDYLKRWVNILNVETGEVRQFDLGQFEKDYQYGACG